MNARRFVAALILVVTGIVACQTAWADPLPGEVLKFRQLPLNNGAVPSIPPTTLLGAPYYGHDELSTAHRTSDNIPWQGIYMADDFADRFNTPVVHVRWWGSYLQNFLGIPTNPGVKRFLISFEDDVPAGPSPTNPLPYSHPGDLKFNQIVTLGPLAPGSGTFTEKLVPTPLMPGMAPLEALYEYNAELHLGKFFEEHRDTVYWLKIVALVDDHRDGFIQWGWHSRDWSIPNPFASTPPAVSPGEGIVGSVIDPDKDFESPVWHFQDDAVTGPVTVVPDPAMPIMPQVFQETWTPTNYLPPWDGPSIIGTFSKDLAFELYTIPEPTALGLMAFAAIAVSATRRRRV